MNIEHLGYGSLAEPLPVISELSNKLRNKDRMGLYLDLLLDNSTSPGAITQTMLTGNLPGLIDIPKEMYFNSTEKSQQ